MNKYSFPPNISEIFDNFTSFTERNQVKYVSGLTGSSFSLLADNIYNKKKKPLFIITDNSENALNLYEDLGFLNGEETTILFPMLEVMNHEISLIHPAVFSQFQNSLIRLSENRNFIAIIPIETAMLKVVNKDKLANDNIKIKVGEETDREFFIELLNEFGYSRVDAVEELGDMAVRGALIDIFPYESDTPVRIEFDDDLIISIRQFDIITQRSVNKMSAASFSSHLFENNNAEFNMTIFDYLDEDTSILVQNHELILNKLNKWKNNDFNSGNEVNLKFHTADIETIEKKIEAKNSIFHVHETNKEDVFHFPFHAPPSFGGGLKLFFSYLKKQKHKSLKNIFIYCENSDRSENLINFIEEEAGVDSLPTIITAPLAKGFSLPGKDLVFLTEHEIFNRLKSSRLKRKIQTAASVLRKINRFETGDLVVHVDYGIGKYLGVEQLRIGQSPPKDVIKLAYRDDDYLYVSLDRLNKIQKYTAGKENYSPQLSKLGTVEWNKTRKRTQKALEKIATDLIRIYAERMTKEGHQYPPDTLWQKEMETSFPFEETADQLRAIEEVKKDMESPRPMDRLICGDVGFGKTEVAIRAAFKAVQENKQVAVLVPTTLLAQQHYHTFSSRLKNFPVEIDVLSRFKSKKAQSDILQKLRSGKIDIIIGTHRLLSSDVAYNSLGLLIVDEEQRFGVTHKEKIKKFKVTVDVLTMTATPIPRTLHMALMGARDLSQIETPPKNRLPVYTEIANWDDALIKKVIKREIERDGQVFFIHNRVETIDNIKAQLGNLVPEAAIAVAHGQLPEKQLEKIMDDFYHKKYNILVASMIIENGIDIPNTNTIIINNAHRFGLSQLYQLRGRVGRSDNQAFAYLLVPNLRTLSQDAIKRLFAIQEYTELGSGLKIAMKDLEIRGGGNMLGHEQSGHINAIGYDYYIKLLKETIDKMKDSVIEEVKLTEEQKLIETAVDIKTELFFPDEFIGSKSEKAFLYYRLGQLNTRQSLRDFTEELEDRFGPLPQSAQNLIFLHYLRIFGGKNYINRITVTENKITFSFHEKFLDNKTKFDKLIAVIHNLEQYQVKFKQAKSLQLAISVNNGNFIDNSFDLTKKLLQEIF